jgi:hypothetical protein
MARLEAHRPISECIVDRLLQLLNANHVSPAFDEADEIPQGLALGQVAVVILERDESPVEYFVELVLKAVQIARHLRFEQLARDGADRLSDYESHTQSTPGHPPK